MLKPIRHTYIYVCICRERERGRYLWRESGREMGWAMHGCNADFSIVYARVRDSSVL